MEHSAVFSIQQTETQYNPVKEDNNCIWASVVQFIAKISESIKSVKTEKFKFDLDKFLELIADKKKYPTLSLHHSNSILDKLPHLRAQGIYQIGGVSDMATGQSWLL